MPGKLHQNGYRMLKMRPFKNRHEAKKKWDRGKIYGRRPHALFSSVVHSTSYVSVAPFSFLFRYIIYQGTFYSHHLLSLFPWQHYRGIVRLLSLFFFRYISIYTKCDEIFISLAFVSI